MWTVGVMVVLWFCREHAEKHPGVKCHNCYLLTNGIKRNSKKENGRVPGQGSSMLHFPLSRQQADFLTGRRTHGQACAMAVW